MNGGSGRHSSRSPEEQEQLDRIEEALRSDPEAEAPEASGGPSGQSAPGVGDLIELNESQAEKLEKIAASQQNEAEKNEELVSVMSEILVEIRSISELIRQMI